MLIFLTIMLGLLSITAHEMGHYEAMRRCGIRIQEVAFMGVPVRFLPSFYLTKGETTWSIHPLLLGAYVRPYPDQDMDTLPLRDQLYVLGAGPLANFIYALAFSAAGYALTAIQTGLAWVAGLSFLFAAAAVLLWVTRRHAVMALPGLIVPAFILLLYSLLSLSPVAAVEAGAGGPVAAITLLTGPQTLVGALFLVALLSLNIGVMNLLPVYPLDGGRIVQSLLKLRFGERFDPIHSKLSTYFFFSLAAYVIGLDLLRIGQWLW